MHGALALGAVWQRTVLFWDALFWDALFWDALRQRAGLPPLLDFKYETILNARGLRL